MEEESVHAVKDVIGLLIDPEIQDQETRIVSNKGVIDHREEAGQDQVQEIED